MPLIAIGLLALVSLAPAFILFSESGPGSMRAPLHGIPGSRTADWCRCSAYQALHGRRNPGYSVNTRRPSFLGSLAIFISALITNLATGGFNAGFEGQPIAHTSALWKLIPVPRLF